LDQTDLRRGGGGGLDNEDFGLGEIGYKWSFKTCKWIITRHKHRRPEASSLAIQISGRRLLQKETVIKVCSRLCWMGCRLVSRTKCNRMYLNFRDPLEYNFVEHASAMQYKRERRMYYCDKHIPGYLCQRYWIMCSILKSFHGVGSKALFQYCCKHFCMVI
jgi:hypothetical protein